MMFIKKGVLSIVLLSILILTFLLWSKAVDDDYASVPPSENSQPTMVSGGAGENNKEDEIEKILRDLEQAKNFRPYGAAVQLRSEELLQASDEKAEMLSAIYLLTGDKKFRDRLETLSSKSPEYAVQFLQMLIADAPPYENEKIETALKASLEKFPDSGILSALNIAYYGDKKSPEMVRELLSALDQKKRSHDVEGESRFSAIREALILSGTPTTAAWVDGYVIDAKATTAFAMFTDQAVNAFRGAASLPENSKIELVSGILGYVDIVNPEGANNTSQGMLSQKLIAGALSLLNDNVESGDQALQVADTLMSMREAQEKSRYFTNEIRPYLFSQEPNVIQVFLEKTENIGFDSAITWFENYKESTE